MQINTLYRLASGAQSSGSSSATATTAGFESALASAQYRLAENSDTPTRALSSGSADASPTRTYRSAAAQELAEYAQKSVAERVRDAVLKDMGLTEEDLAAMDPEKRAAVEQEIARRVKAILTGQYDSDQPDAKRTDTLASSLALA